VEQEKLLDAKSICRTVSIWTREGREGKQENNGGKPTVSGAGETS